MMGRFNAGLYRLLPHIDQQLLKLVAGQFIQSPPFAPAKLSRSIQDFGLPFLSSVTRKGEFIYIFASLHLAITYSIFTALP